jgi:alpha-L-arabinofuranosidase
MRYTLFSLLATSLLMADLCATTAFAARPGPIEIRIQTDQPGAPIDRNVFGQFAEHLGSGIYDGIWVGKDSRIANVRGIRSDVVAALRRLHVPNVRWPGGCFADEYHWRDGVGPASMRKSTVNSNWGGAIETNAFGTDEFMDFTSQIGSDAYISLNVGSGTPAEAAAWMAYMTADARTTAGRERAANGHAAPYNVRFVGIGNESWGCGGSMSPDYYVSQLKLYSRFAHNLNPAHAGEHSMWSIAVGADGANTDYVEAVMRAWKERPWSWDMEAVSLHSYTSAGWPPKHPSTGFDEAEYALLLADTLHMDTLISRAATIMDRYDPHKKIALAVDEWGAWLAPLAGTNPGYLVQQNSLRDAILAALNLNIFARHADRVKMANIAQMINVLQAMIMTRGEKIVLTPTYHVFRLYVPFQDATFLPVRLAAGVYSSGSAKLPRVDAIAARDGQGRVWLAAVNLDAHESVTLHLATSAGEARSAVGEVLTAARVDSVNTFEAPEVVKPVAVSAQRTPRGLALALPSKSVAVVEIR